VIYGIRRVFCPWTRKIKLVYYNKQREIIMKVLEGIPVFRSGYQNYVNAVFSVLSYYNEKTSIDELEEIAGKDGIFEFHFSELWHDEASIYSRTEDVLGLICGYFGYEHEWFLNKDFDSTWQKIKECIDEGYPVITQSLGSEISQYRGEWMIICGYSEEGEEPIVILSGSGESFICTPFPERRDDTEDIEWGNHFPFQEITTDFYADKPLFIVGKKLRKKQHFDEKEFAGLNLLRIVKYAGKEYVGGEYKLWGGIKGMEIWQKFLNEISDDDIKNIVETSQKYIVYFNINLPNFLLKSRKHISFYLFKIADYFEKPVIQKLWKAAEYYSKVSEYSLEFIDLLYGDKSTWKDEELEKEVRRGSERIVNGEYRSKAVEIIGKIIEMEKSAVNLVREASLKISNI